MSVIVTEERLVTPMKCHRCSYHWNYGGNNGYYATCPHCRTYVSIRKYRQKISQTGLTLERPVQSVEINSLNRGESTET